jgi:hypothetical protein
MTAVGNRQENRRKFSTGKDELNLADWPISISTHQQILKSTASDGKKIDYIEYLIPRSKQGDQKVTLMAPAAIGLPTPRDEDLVIALIQLSKEQDNFASPTVRFLPATLLDAVRWPNNGTHLDRLEEGMLRLTAVTIKYELAWYDRGNTDLDDVVTMTGILAEAELLRRRRRLSNEDRSRIVWTPHFHGSLAAGNLTNLNLDLYFSLDRPTAKRLLRHLNKRFYGARERERYERNLTHLACGHLGMANNKDLRRNLQRAIDELEEREYILPLTPAERFIKVGPGNYRVVFDLHPSRLTKVRAIDVTAKPSDDARKLVTTYHEHRFKRKEHEPRDHELAKAGELFNKYDADLLFKLLPEAAIKTESSYKGDDVHFGAATAIIERIAEQRLKRAEQNRRKDLEIAVQRSEADEAEIANAERIKRHKALQQAWDGLSDGRRQAYVNKAIANAKSNFEREQIRKRKLTEPFFSVLNLFAADMSEQN